MRLYLTIVQKKIPCDSILDSITFLENLARSMPLNKINLFHLPELWLSGFNKQKLAHYAKRSAELIYKLQIFCKKFNINLCGTISEHCNHSSKLYNSFIFISANGEIISRYHKIHLFPLTLENDFFLKGNDPVIVNFQGIKLGFAICYDIRFPELFRHYSKNGVELVLVSACFPNPRLRDWRILLQARAIENQFFVSAVNAVGSELVNNQKLVYFGHSMLVNPQGKVLTELDKHENTKTIFIDSKDISEARGQINYLNDIKSAY